ncbi:DUF3995 domain-containing protein [Pseudactinotalea sp.]|uniref:DUF3995 domain-containing protein n=1 Tax=Pseudactinotalea sp. TaxID=1926260 RepID=UPI003B3B868B
MSWTTRTPTGIRNVHEREVAATPAEVWELMSAFGTPADRVWPSDRWPALTLSDGVRVGSHGGHGPIRYRVEAVEDGAGLTFRFDPEAGISGAHAFTLAPTSIGTRVMHTMLIDHPGTAVATVIVPLHDALLEDLLDQLEALVAHRELRRRPLPLAVRARRAAVAASQAPPSVPSMRRRALAVATAATLGGIGALHLAWGFGATWPASTAEGLTRTVVGIDDQSRAPGLLACAAVAGALGVAAGSALATTSSSNAVRTIGTIGAGVTSGVLALRGVAGLVQSTVFPTP